MNTRESFLADVIANPADDAVRLIYADWLEDNGEGERAEFIRVQCELAIPCRHEGRLHHDQCERCNRLRKRERELLVHTADWWINEVAKPLGWKAFNLESRHSLYMTIPHEWARGFVAQLTLPAEIWLAHADTLTAAQPIERVTLTTWPDSADHSRMFMWNGESGRRWISIDVAIRERWPRIAFTLPPRLQGTHGTVSINNGPLLNLTKWSITPAKNN